MDGMDIVHDEPPELQVINALPVSFRSAQGEQFYQNARMLGSRTPLDEEAAIVEFKYWRVIDNKYPYDIMFKTSHMLIPRRVAADYHSLTPEETEELHDLLNGWVMDQYNGYMVGSYWRRSNNDHYHVHLINFYDAREDMRL